MIVNKCIGFVCFPTFFYTSYQSTEESADRQTHTFFSFVNLQSKSDGVILKAIILQCLSFLDVHASVLCAIGH